MDPVVNVTVVAQPVTVSLTTPAPVGVDLNLQTTSQPVTVSLTSSPAAAITLSLTLTTQPVSVSIQTARDAYQLALADGYVGTRAEWAASLAGTSVTPVVLTLAAYLALTAPQQLDATKWYVIPS